MDKMIDLRSDTVTFPTEEMRKAIANAQLGDDVFREDPTVNKLENKAANILGKEAGLLVPSGTMGNLVSLLTNCQRGTELLLGDKSHTFYYEAGGISAFGGIHSRQLKNQPDGTIKISDIQSAIRVDNVHFPKTSAITLENTHNLCNGSPLSPEYTRDVANIAHSNDMKLHIDGARIFNAAVSLDVDVKDLVANADSVTFCLSKGLSAPVGSVICGNEKFIYHARRNRKALGGGMRQAGIIAAAGIVSLDQMFEQIREDHKNAKILAEGIANIEGLFIDRENIKSNILYFHIEKGKRRSEKLAKQTNNRDQYPFAIKLNNSHFFESSPSCFRLVTHYGITGEDVAKTLVALGQMLK
jgi:threonine aldolase